MRTQLKKSSLVAMRSLIILCSVLAACAKNTSTNLTPEHRADSNLKTSVQKMRQACYSQPQGRDRTVADNTGVQICTLRPVTNKDGSVTATYKLSNDPRKFKIAQQKAKDGSLVEEITLNIGVDFDNAKSPLQPADKAAVVELINEQCKPNILTYWSKSNIKLDLNMQSSVTGAPVDQTLALEYVPVKASASPGDGDLNYSFQIEQWSQIPDGQFLSASTDSCNKEAANGGLPHEKKQLRAKCMREKVNQPFCLSLNKMVGHWLGAVDHTDTQCPLPAVAPAAGTPTPTDEDDKPSIMTYVVNPPKVASATDNKTATDAPAATTPAATTPGVDDKAKTSQATIAVAMAAAFDQQTAADVAAGVAGDDPNVTPPKPAPQPTKPATDLPADQSNDPSYAKWVNYKVSTDDIGLIFKCDMTKAEQKVPKDQDKEKKTPQKPKPVPQQPAPPKK